MSAEPRKPQVFRLDDPDVRVAAPGESTAGFLDKRAVVVPEMVEPPSLPETPAAPRGRGLGGWLLGFASGLVALAAGLSATALVEEAFARSAVLGWIGVALAAGFVAVLAIVVGREVAGLLRLGKVDALRRAAEAAIASDDGPAARRVVADALALYAARAEMAGARGAAQRLSGEVIDGANRVRAAERALMAELDRKAVRLVTDAAKRVSIVTAVSPRAVFDVAVVTAESARLVRGLADLYGARPGKLGFARLSTAVSAHLVITGGMAMGETLVQQIVGHGLAARLSAKLGEGIVNGLMTARVGLSTIDLVRPLPFSALERPKLGDVMAEITRSGA
jgi:putative membrane protein